MELGAALGDAVDEDCVVGGHAKQLDKRHRNSFELRVSADVNQFSKNSMRSAAAQNATAFLYRGLCSKSGIGKSSEDITKMRPNCGETGFISGSSVEMAKKDFIRLEHEEIDTRQQQDTLIADLDRNKQLNRWYNVLPFDATRVKLLPTSVSSQNSNNGESGFNDYINASRIDAPFLDNKSYILSQGTVNNSANFFQNLTFRN